MDHSQLAVDAAKAVGQASQDIAVSASQVAPQAASHVSDPSIFSMFWNAGFMIKLVMLTLFAASIWSWTVIITKHIKLKRLNLDADIFEENFWSGMPLETLYKEIKESAFDPMANVFCAAMAEWERYMKKENPKPSAKALESRIDKAMRIAIQKEVDELERGLSFLSSLGTNGVIIGLFGTVLGIMGGFKMLALQQNSAIIPVIAESLFTTALGLVAAIPAAIGYNMIAGKTNRYISRLETFADEFCSIISRQLDEE